MTPFPALPLLLALYPLLQLYASNTAQTSPWALLRPGLVLLVVAGGLVLAGRRLLGSPRRGDLFAAAVLALLWWPDWLVTAIEGNLGTDPSRGTPVPLVLAGVVALLVLVHRLLARLPEDGPWIRRGEGGLRVLVGVLALGAVLQAAYGRVVMESHEPLMPALVHAVPRVERRPDIYYVLLDAYARADVLAAHYEHDNGPFLRELEGLGFRVLDRARANYAWTLQSVGSTLGLGYLLPKGVRALFNPRDTSRMAAMIRRPHARRFLAQQGYETLSVASGAQLFDHTDFDTRVNSSFSETENLLLRFSLVGELFPTLAFANRRAQLDRALAALAPPPADAPPRFAMVHVLAPHPPYVWREDGSPAEPFPVFDIHDNGPVIDSIMGPGWYRARYRDQLRHLNARLLARLREILARTDRESVVILQGDHGPLSHAATMTPAEKLRERFAILHAWRGPPELLAKLRPDQTPVQTFRLLFDELFGAAYGPLPDESFYNEALEPFGFQKIPPEPPPAPPPGT